MTDNDPIEPNPVFIEANDQTVHPRRDLVLPVLQNCEESVVQCPRSSPEVAVRPRIISHRIGLLGVIAMRSVLALGLLIALCASANAAKVHHSKPRTGHLRPAQLVAASKGYAVPGWTEEQTRYWLDSFHGGTD